MVYTLLRPVSVRGVGIVRDGEPLGGHTNASNDFDAVDDGDEDFLN